MLEGIGLIEKTIKNKIRWRGLHKMMVSSCETMVKRDQGLDRAYKQSEKELEALVQEGIEIDEIMLELQEEMTEMARYPAYDQFAYLTFEDISQLSTMYGTQEKN